MDIQNNRYELTLVGAWVGSDRISQGSFLDNNWIDQQVLPSLQIMPALYVNSHRDDDFDGDKAPPQASCEEGDSGVLSAEEWKYVLRDFDAKSINL